MRIWGCGKENSQRAVAWQQRNPEKYRVPYHDHGLTRAEADSLKRDKVCEICGSDRNLVIDHDHETGLIRGVLCNRCNVGLGQFGDNPDRLRTALAYLESHSG